MVEAIEGICKFENLRIRYFVWRWPGFQTPERIIPVPQSGNSRYIPLKLNGLMPETPAFGLNTLHNLQYYAAGNRK
jgi:hypothetical protein